MSDETTTAKPKRTPIRLPFAFGDVVYFRHRTEKIPGIVVGFIVVESNMRVLVRWTDDLCQVEHNFFELTTEFNLFGSEESPS